MTRPIASLKEELQNWTQRDQAAYALGVHLGLWSRERPLQTNLKHVFWSDNPIGSALYEAIDALVGVGVLEHDDEEDLIRWNSGFKGKWDKS